MTDRSMRMINAAFRFATSVAALGATCLIAGDAGGQGAPGTDIHLLPLTIRAGQVTVGAPVSVTTRVGYDHQPSFTTDGGAVLFTSARGGGQTDIYRYDISSRQTTRVMDTPESEYSAIVMPGGRRISTIRVEADSTQRLWSFAMDGSDPQVVLRDIKPVGYHAWANDSTLALFVLGARGQPSTLQIANARSGVGRTVASNIGRSLHRIPGTASVSFVHKVSADEWWIRRLDPANDSIVAIVKTLPGVEDYAWLPDGSLLMARANALFRWTPPVAGSSAPNEWQVLATFDNAALTRISRLAVSPAGDWVALVANEVPPR